MSVMGGRVALEPILEQMATYPPLGAELAVETGERLPGRLVDRMAGANPTALPGWVQSHLASPKVS